MRVSLLAVMVLVAAASSTEAQAQRVSRQGERVTIHGCLGETTFRANPRDRQARDTPM